MDAARSIIRPVVSEKSYVLASAGKYTFRVHPNAHKTQIRQAVEELFPEVKVLDVRTVTVKSKPKRRGWTSGRSRQWKKAIVQVRPGDEIPIFAGLEGLASNGHSQAQAHQPRPPLRHLLRLRRGHQDEPGEVARPRA